MEGVRTYRYNNYEVTSYLKLSDEQLETIISLQVTNPSEPLVINCKPVDGKEDLLNEISEKMKDDTFYSEIDTFVKSKDKNK